MLTNKIKILIIEDEGIVAADIAAQLEQSNYIVTGIADTGEEALEMVKTETPDLILMDINIRGDIDGIETATLINKIKIIPVIYLTAQSDENTWERARHTIPAAYITKPFRRIDLTAAIDLALLNASHPDDMDVAGRQNKGDILYKLNDCFFIRNGNGHFEKTLISDVLYLEAKRAYCDIITRTRKYTLSVSLGSLMEKISGPDIVRIHKSYGINPKNIDALTDNTVVIHGVQIPIGSNYRTAFFDTVTILR